MIFVHFETTPQYGMNKATVYLKPDALKLPTEISIAVNNTAMPYGGKI